MINESINEKSNEQLKKYNEFLEEFFDAFWKLTKEEQMKFVAQRELTGDDEKEVIDKLKEDPNFKKAYKEGFKLYFYSKRPTMDSLISIFGIAIVDPIDNRVMNIFCTRRTPINLTDYFVKASSNAIDELIAPA